MKALAGICGAIIGLLIVGGAAWLIFRPAQTPARASSAQSLPGPDDSASGPPKPSQPLIAPTSREEQLKAGLNEKRIPFFHYLSSNFGDNIEKIAVLQDYDTLDMVVKKGDTQTLTNLVSAAIAPTAKSYGFRRVRFYTRNAPTSVDPLTIVAEASDDGSGQWHTFLK